MNSFYRTVFQEVEEGLCDLVLLSNEAVVFRTKPDSGFRNGISPMMCDAFCVLLVKGGTATLSVNYSSELLHPDTLVFLTPNMVLSLSDADADFSLEGVCFYPAYFDDLSVYTLVYAQMISFLNEKTMPVQSLSAEEMKSLTSILGLYSDISMAQFYQTGLLAHLSNLLLLRVVEILRSSGVSDTVKVSHPVEIYREFRKLLKTYCLKEHYIAFYASQLNVSTTYLSRIVRQVSGRTVNDHIAHMLITEIRRMLDCTDMPIKQIADRMGFADQASFGKFFRKQLGVSPSIYRRNNK